MNDHSADQHRVDHLRVDLRACLAVPRWIDEVAEQAPFASVDDLLEAGRTAANPLTPDEVEAALADHPRIGDKPVGEGASRSFSRSEQASLGDGDAETAAAIAEGNAIYEKRFDRVFLIRAAGRSRAEILAELNRRIRLDDDDEFEIVEQQLREIALLRLEKTFTERGIGVAE
ncbi:2-oxo-4-hydroxy-4-carboxy-5-ureidoimidazoline decarboxylase [Agreia bicolorata]|uniref:2-oxo-4-hydroxy-4-carboxy-5-ureidoimidazoline decarboxylase n=1 Tax=Agreia bicolorata TaxID=110935 RepID=A0A1T4YG09_9MICO|nr:2-oxo-4-hydroxy-4-carboxy-5-ureidoimidazoline decarboxylase [Agreia bicolorata]SKB00762.1 2-oxo-4-hydroxy-4-carboxy-5-ureidoimidazoline decarboxylase [Agreia bicolorata]